MLRSARLSRTLLATAVFATAALGSASARAQGFALDQFHPAPAGDDFFVVQGTGAGAKPLGYAAMVLGEYARSPFVLYNVKNGEPDTQAGSVVSDQLYLHVAASLGLKYALLSVDLPIALLDTGGNSGATATTLPSPSGAAMGDLRAGLRIPLFGVGGEKGREPAFGAALTGYVWFPTGDQASYAGEGSVRGMPGLSLGGRVGLLRYGVNGGVVIRPETTLANTGVGTQLSFGGGIAAVLLDDKLQVGPEVYGNTVLVNGGAFDRGTTNLEGILGAKLRVGPVVFGGGAGPGLTQGLGTPSLRAVLSVAYAPVETDRDHDGIEDAVDACPDVPGVASADAAKNGCPPPPDRDHDGIVDADDACPDKPGVHTDDPKTNGCADGDKDGIFDNQDACPAVAGVADPDPKKNGCPVSDKDEDGIPDASDACPEVAGVADADPAKNGCPPDKDGDGIFDKDDACPDVKGIANVDPKLNGCPPDTDGDGIRDDKDACPNEKGVPDPDPTKNGCPTKVRVTKEKIEILQQVQFKTGSDKILPASDDLLSQVAEVLKEHTEIKKVLVEGHTDNRGGKAFNQSLSDRRAKSVMKWLVAHGIDKTRLEAKGFGQDRPIADNKTEEGRQQNRRVEFKILESSAPSGEAGTVAPAPASPAPAAAPQGGGATAPLPKPPVPRAGPKKPVPPLPPMRKK